LGLLYHMGPLQHQWEISRILKWRYVSTIFQAIFCWDIPLDRPYIGLIYGRYLQFRFLKWPLTTSYNCGYITAWFRMILQSCSFSRNISHDPQIDRQFERPEIMGKHIIYNVQHVGTSVKNCCSFFLGSFYDLIRK
jgi:hypothetical protein